MKQLALPTSILALVLTIDSFFYNSSSPKQVYVDVNKLLEDYERTKIVRTEFVSIFNSVLNSFGCLVTNSHKQTHIKTE